MSDEAYLEDWAWRQASHDDWWRASEHGWIVTGHNNLQPKDMYDVMPYVGDDGGAITIPHVASLEPSVTLTYADSDPVQVADAVAQMIRLIPKWDRLFSWPQLVMWPYADMAARRLEPVYARGIKCDYAHGGRQASVTIDWVSPAGKWYVDRDMGRNAPNDTSHMPVLPYA